MAEITKKDLKGAVSEAIEPFAKSVQRDFQKVHSRLGGVEDRLGGVENRLTSVEFDLSEVKKGVAYVRQNSSELFTRLDKFIAMYEKQDQELAILGE